MKNKESKQQLLSNISEEYIKQAVLQINNSPRYSTFSKSGLELLDYASQKMSIEQIKVLRKGYFLNMPPNQIGLNFREKNGKEIAKEFLKIVKPKIFRKELTITNRVCDIAYVQNGDIVAIEIKANGDNIRKAIGQCIEYSKWANYTYLLVEPQKVKELNKIKMPKGIGVLIIKNKEIEYKKRARYVSHNLSIYLNLLNNKKLQKITKVLKIKNVKQKKKMLSKIVFESKINHKIEALGKELLIR